MQSIQTMMKFHLLSVFILLTSAADLKLDNASLNISHDLPLSTVYPKLDTIVWPEETNMWYISRQSDAVYNYKIRDEMERRVDELQKKIHRDAGLSDQDRKQVGMKILENYQTQRLMREMQRSLDSGEMTAKEQKHTKDKLNKLVMEIKAGETPVVIEPVGVDELKNIPFLSRTKKSPSLTTISLAPHYTTSTNSTPPLLSEIFPTTTTTRTPQLANRKNLMDEYEKDPEKFAMMKEVKAKFATVMKKKAERDMMSHLLKAGIKGYTPIGKNTDDKRKSNISVAPRKRRDIPVKLYKLPVDELLNIHPLKEDQDGVNVQEMSAALEETIYSFFDGVPITKTFYEFFVDDTFQSTSNFSRTFQSI